MVNKNNSCLQKDFLDYLKSTHKSAGTIKGYENDLNIFWVWVLDNLDNKDFKDITKRELVRFQNWLVEDNKNSPARVRRIKSAISSLSNYIEAILDEEEEFKGFRSIIRKIDNPALQQAREKTVWEESELISLLDKLTESKKYEQACYVALAMYSGRRKAELGRFKVSDFDDSKLVCDGALYKSSPILTKGGKMLECFTLAKKFKPYFNNWMNERVKKNIDSEWLFPDATDLSKSKNISTFNSWARSFSVITGRDFYIHSLRHFYCTALLRAHIPDSVVVEIIGWASAEMLKIYDDTPKDEKIASYFRNGEISIPETASFSSI